VITELVEVISVTTEFIDVSPKDNTLIFSKLIYVITGIVEVLHEDPSDKLPPMHDIQHIIDLTPGASLLDLPHHRMDPTMHIKLKGQVDKLSLEIKQQCFIPINIYFYEDKFMSYIVIKDVGMIKNVIIYDRSIFKIFENTVMGVHDALQIINSSISVKL